MAKEKSSQQMRNSYGKRKQLTEKEKKSVAKENSVLQEKIRILALSDALKLNSKKKKLKRS